MFIHIIVIINITVISKVAAHYNRLGLLFGEGKGKGKDSGMDDEDMVGDEQVLIIILFVIILFIIILLLNKCSINNISYDANY